MAIVLGPELALFLRGIGEDLKGKTILEEPYVDRKTIVRAVSEQNKVILALQSQVIQMRETEERMQHQLEMMQEKVTCLEKYTGKVDSIEAILSEKLPQLQKLDEKVKEHDGCIEQITTETRGVLSQNCDDLNHLRKELKSMPEMIVISTRQVTHSNRVEASGIDISSNNSDVDHKELLADIIQTQDKRALLNDRQINGLEIKMDDVTSIQNERIDCINKSVDELTEWKKAQSEVDQEKMKKNQDAMILQIDECKESLSHKMTKEDVESKLNRQFDEIVNHLQSALSSIENEEADFKCITDSLSKMCESLHEIKADKADIVALRKQFIESQVEGIYPRTGSTLDNESIRRILANYPTKDTVLKMLEGKSIQHNGALPEIVRIDSRIHHLQSIIKQLLASISDETNVKPDSLKMLLALLESDITESYSEEKSSPENSHPNIHQENDIMSSSSRIETLNKAQRSSPSLTSQFHSNRQKSFNNDNAVQFPSSNVLNGVLGEVHRHDKTRPPSRQKKNKDINIISEKRPFSAPSNKVLPEANDNTGISKKHSLPAILTSISKTMRPRSKMKSRQKSQNNENIIYKGSYSTINSDKSSDHFISQPLKDLKNPPISSEQYSKKKQVY